jgi:hypothetical protein
MKKWFAYSRIVNIKGDFYRSLYNHCPICHGELKRNNDWGRGLWNDPCCEVCHIRFKPHKRLFFFDGFKAMPLDSRTVS